MSKHIWRFLCAFTVLGLCGCTLITDVATGVDSVYPEDWPAISETTGECPDLSGRFENTGLATFLLEPEEELLTVQILGMPTHPEYVSLESREDGLTIEFAIREDLQVSRFFSKAEDQVRCDDGSLVAESRDSVAGAILWIIPTALARTSWYRWEPYASE